MNKPIHPVALIELPDGDGAAVMDNTLVFSIDGAQDNREWLLHGVKVLLDALGLSSVRVACPVPAIEDWTFDDVARIFDHNTGRYDPALNTNDENDQ